MRALPKLRASSTTSTFKSSANRLQQPYTADIRPLPLPLLVHEDTLQGVAFGYPKFRDIRSTYFHPVETMAPDVLPARLKKQTPTVPYPSSRFEPACSQRWAVVVRLQESTENLFAAPCCDGCRCYCRRRG